MSYKPDLAFCEEYMPLQSASVWLIRRSPQVNANDQRFARQLCLIE